MCLEENIVVDAPTLDLALIYGIGFPVFQGGLLKYADKRGITRIVEQLTELHLLWGERFKPARLLIKMAENNQNFYSN